MPHSTRQSDNPVSSQLFDQPWEFEFFQAVLLLEQLRNVGSSTENIPPDLEVVSFRSAVTQVFPASEIQALEPAGALGTAPALTVNLLSLGGAGGPLPEAYSSLLMESAWRKNFAMRDFLDIFHHRLLSLLVCDRKTYHPSYTSLAPHRGPAAQYLYAFFGMALEQCRNRMPVVDRSLLHYSGILAQHPRSASGLERLLADYFQIPVHVNQLLGQWRELEPCTWTRLGLTGSNQTLGQTALLGSRIWDQQGRFEVILGPMNMPVFLDLLPQGSGFEPLCQLTRFYAGPECEFGFRLTLRAGEVPRTRIGESRLGWTSWLRTQPRFRDDSQVRLNPLRSGAAAKRSAALGLG